MKTSLPKGWSKMYLFEILETLENGSRPKGGIKAIDVGIPSLGAEHLDGDGGFKFKNIRLIPKIFYKELKKGKIQKHDILLVKDGATTGKVSIIPDNFRFTEASVNEHLFILRGKKDFIDQKFLFYHLFSPIGQRYIESNIHGATVGGITTPFIHNYQILLPPLKIQQKIVSILEKTHQMTKMRNEINALTKDLMKSIFLEMFGDPIENSKKWDTIQLGKICQMRRGASPRPIDNYLGGDVPWIKIGDATKGNDLFIEQTKVKVTKEGASKSVLLNPETLIFANCGVSLGFARILKIQGCIHDGWLSFENLHEDIDKIFLLKLINQITNYLKKIAPDGTQPNLNTSIMKNLKIIMPPISLQKKFSETILSLEKLKEPQKLSKIQTQNLFELFMKKIFLGELIC